MKFLLLIPSVLKTGVAEEVAADRHPTMDYHALAASLGASPSDQVDVVDYDAADRPQSLWGKWTRRFGGRDASLALLGFQKRNQYDAIFTNGENVGIPLALLFHFVKRRPGHVTIGHRLSTGKKRLFFTRLQAHRQIDTIFVYATTQWEFAKSQLGIAPETLSLIPFHADDCFYRPLPEAVVSPHQICSAGLEWRDYPTLIEAVASMPDLQVKLAAASPWSKHANETENRTLPGNVTAQRYEYGALRQLYAESAFVVVPLYENDFQAGVTTILEAMSMGKAVIATRTTGQTDVIVDGANGLFVASGDVAGWRSALERLQQDEALRTKLGTQARRWIEENATLALWVDRIAAALRRSAEPSYSRSNQEPRASSQADLA